MVNTAAQIKLLHHYRQDWEPPTTSEEIIISGTGGSAARIPQHFKGDIWGIAHTYRIAPCDRIFFADPLDWYIDKLFPGTMAELAALQVPVITHLKYDQVPLSEAFPHAAVYRKFGAAYYQSSLSFALAYALLCPTVKGIKFYGIEGTLGANVTEYSSQRGSLEYWLGIAHGLGVSVEVPYNSGLIFRESYGHDVKQLQQDLAAYLANEQQGASAENKRRMGIDNIKSPFLKEE